MPTKRDPRKDPKRGDVLDVGLVTWTVRHRCFTDDCPHVGIGVKTKGIHGASPTEITLAFFIECTRNATVTHAAD